jgi:O-antigen ligase
MLGDRWAAGTGAGTFACAFPYYQPPALTGLYFRYAHNDWLEYPTELGAIGTALLAWLVGAVLWPVRVRGGQGDAPSASDGRGRHRRSTWRRYERRGIALALAGMSIHALVDFPLHIPATLLTASALAGLAGRRDPTG